MRVFPVAAAVAAIAAAPAAAHFGIILPDTAMLAQERQITLRVGFGHPHAPAGLELARPRAMSVTTEEGTTDLLPALQDAEFHNALGFQVGHTVARPGVQVFHMEPEPYWEPAEDIFIIHYTKVYVPAFGDDAGWNIELGLPIEIVPRSRPFGLWAGNVFQGVVKRNGEPLAGAEIEVEFYNADGAVEAPPDLMAPQTIHADENGMFIYAAPAPGWWGFAALDTADEEIEQDGEPKEVEIGGVLWVHFEHWPGRE